MADFPAAFPLRLSVSSVSLCPSFVFFGPVVHIAMPSRIAISSRANAHPLLVTHSRAHTRPANHPLHDGHRFLYRHPPRVELHVVEQRVAQVVVEIALNVAAPVLIHLPCLGR